MVSRLHAILLTCSVLVLFVGGYAATTADPSPELTVENEGNVTYEVDVYTVNNRTQAAYLNFAVTSRSGERRLATLAELGWPGEFRDVTLADERVDHQEIVVEPNETVTVRLDHWQRGEGTVYIGQEYAGNRTHVETETNFCGRPDQDHYLRFDEDGGGGGSTCGGGPFWFLF